jgi:SAM-dependent methyltransferase/RimJ/RimL family protein N-acetyltransferase
MNRADQRVGADADPHLFFTTASAPHAPRQYELPPGYTQEWWTQRSPLSIPPGVAWNWRFAAWWLLFRQKSMRAVVIREAGSKRVAHIAYVYPKYFRFPFMRPGDLQIGGLYTPPYLRGKGLARAAVSEILRRCASETSAFWYVVRSSNRSSIAVATACQFELAATGVRAHSAGATLLGRFVVDPLPAGAGDDRGEVGARIRSGAAFDLLTETTGTELTSEGASMVYTRYWWARELARDRRVLEIACGSGQGLQLIAETARGVVAGDLSAALLARASEYVRREVPLVRFRADALPFRKESFDLALLFEASYYMPDWEAVLREIESVLSPGGIVAIVSANPQRPGFIRSPFSSRYHTAYEHAAALQACGFDVKVDGAFPVAEGTHFTRLRGSLLNVVRRVATTLGLVPRTLEGRAKLKRLIFGPPVVLPEDVPKEFARLGERVALEPSANEPGRKVLYVFGTKRGR